MKILYISHGFPSITSGSYGVGTAAYSAATGMASRGHDVRVLCPGPKKDARMVGGVTCRTFVPGQPNLDSGNPYAAKLDILRSNTDAHLWQIYHYWCEYVDLVASGWVPDIVDCPDFTATGYYYAHHRLLGYPEAAAPLLTFCKSYSRIANEYDEQIAYAWDNFLPAERELFQMAASDALAAPSKYMSDLIHSRYHLPKPEVCYDNSLHALPENLLPPCENNELLYFGQIRFIKGLTHLLKVCSYLWDEGTKFVLKLIGFGIPYAAKNLRMDDYLKSAYGEYIRRGVLQIFPHTDDFETIRKHLEQSRAVVHASLMESLGHTCIEASCFGRPIITSSTGGHTEVVEHGSSGFIYRDLTELESYIKRVLAASRDELEEWGINANRRACEMFAAERTLPAMEQLYAKVIEQSAMTTRRSFPNCSFLDKRRFIQAPSPQQHDPVNGQVKGLVSVVISCYNLGQFIEEAVESVIKSSYRPMEVIVIDDGSKDALTQAAVEGLQGRTVTGNDFSFRVVRNARNRGISEVRNLGATMAHGEFLCFVDGDDRVEPFFFQKAVEVLRQYPEVGFVGGWCQNFGLETRCWIMTDSFLPLSIIWGQAHASCVIRRSAYEFQHCHILIEEHDFFIAVNAKGWVGVTLAEIVLQYRVRADSRFHSAHLNELKISWQYIVENHPELFKQYGGELFLLLIQNYYYALPDARQRAAELAGAASAQYDEWWGRVSERPVEIVKWPLYAAKLLIPSVLKQRIRKAFRMPQNKRFGACLMERISSLCGLGKKTA